jgi:putative zinc finger/helix-turn-helix YgiT family protein
MICFECGRNNLEPSWVSLTSSRNNESFTVELNGFKCQDCGFQTVDSSQSAELTRLVSDAYRVSHGLLTGEEIKARRKQLGMSQEEFADYLGVGGASIKRWESGKIQEKAMDELLRLKTDPEAARRNLQDVESQVQDVLVLSVGVICGKSIELSLPSREQRYLPVSRIVLDDAALRDMVPEMEPVWAAA